PTALYALSLHDALPILRRDVKERFDNADEMLTAWRSVFTGVSVPRADHIGDDATVGQAPDFTPMVTRAKRETPLAEIGLSTRARSEEHTSELQSRGHLV